MARPRSVSDDDILDAARRVFLEHGFHASVARVAEEVGLSGPALLKRFGTKEALFIRAMQADRAPPFVAACLRGPDDRPMRDQLVELARTMQAFYADMVPRFAALHGTDCIRRAFPPTAVPPPVAAFRALTHWFDAAGREGRIRPVRDPRCPAEALFAAVAHRYFAMTLLDDAAPTFADEALYLEDLVDALWFGLAPASEGP